MYDKDAKSIRIVLLEKITKFGINQQAIPIILILNNLNNLIAFSLGDLIFSSSLFIQCQIITKCYNRWFTNHY